jgi:hypothetical protein
MDGQASMTSTAIETLREHEEPHHSDSMSARAAARAATWGAAWGKAQAGVLILIVVTVIVGVGVYSAAESFDTEIGMAIVYHVAFPRFAPLSLEGGYFGLIVFDMATTWKDEPIWPLRIMVPVFSGIIVAVNAKAGWPSVWGVVLHAGPAILVLVFIEVARYWLMRRKMQEEREARQASRKARRQAREASRRVRRAARSDRIPLVRWLIAFGETVRVWKRMHLWNESSYSAYIDLESERLTTVQALAERYPNGWEASIPADIAYMLTTGIRIRDGLRRAKEHLRTEDRLKAARTAQAHAEAQAQRGIAEAEERAERAEAEAERLDERCTELGEAIPRLRAESAKAFAELQKTHENEAAGLRAEAERLGNEIARAKADLDLAEINAQRAEAARAGAEAEAEALRAKNDRLNRKLGGAAAPKRAAGATDSANRNGNAGRTPFAGNPELQAEARRLLEESPGITGAAFGESLGYSDRWGQIHIDELRNAMAASEEAAPEPQREDVQ